MSGLINLPYALEWAEEGHPDFYTWGPDPVPVEYCFNWERVDPSTSLATIDGRAHKFGTGDVHDWYQVFPNKGIIK